MNYPNNHKHKFIVKDGDKAFPIMMCEECEFELDKEYYDGYVVPLEAKLKKALHIGYDCGHEKQDVIDGDCVHCNLKVAEGSVLSLQAKLKEANSIIEAKHDYCSSLCCDIANLQDRLANSWEKVEPEKLVFVIRNWYMRADGKLAFQDLATALVKLLEGSPRD
jgi:hypothetical protein